MLRARAALESDWKELRRRSSALAANSSCSFVRAESLWARACSAANSERASESPYAVAFSCWRTVCSSRAELEQQRLAALLGLRQIELLPRAKLLHMGERLLEREGLLLGRRKRVLGVRELLFLRRELRQSAHIKDERGG